MKEFNLEAAKAGKAVCTRDGRKARVICWDRISEHGNYSLVALVTNTDGDEDVFTYRDNGSYMDIAEDGRDLMMTSEKKEGWVNLYREIDGNIECSMIRSSKEESESHISPTRIYLDTVKIEWEE